MEKERVVRVAVVQVRVCDFCSIGTLVVRMTGSSLLVDEEVEGGGRGGGRLLPACFVAARGCGRVEVVVRVERLR